MKNGKKRKLKFIPLVIIIMIAIGVSTVVKMSEGPVTIDTILKYTPDNIYIAIIVLLGIFALKSLSIVLPLSVLYLASGVLFPPLIAVLVSTVGFWITITIPYFIGYFYGQEIKGSVLKKYPKVKKIEKFQFENNFFLCFITRMAGFLPADLLSIYFGLCRISYGVYALAGVTGSLLSIVTTTLLGNKLKDPFSKEFVIIVLCRIVLVIFSFLVKYQLSSKKRKRRKEIKYGEKSYMDRNR